MNKLLEQIAVEKALSTDDVIDIIDRLSKFIINRVPEFKPVIQDVFINADADILNRDINVMILCLKERDKIFREWSMPKPTYLFRQNENDPLF